MPHWLEVSIQLLTALFMLIGLVGLVVPIFPGLVIIWLAALIYGLLTGFSTLAWVMFAIITVLMIIGNVADNLMMGKKALDNGAAWSSIAIGYVAGFAASIFLTPLAGLAAAPLALFGAEYVRLKDRDKAFETTKAMMIGLGWAFVVRFCLGLVMIILWSIWASA
ncbi:MAG: DUF456 domain-containing protein [Chloroflexota bacterium]